MAHLGKDMNKKYRNNILHLAMKYCWLIPLIFGITVFFVWVITRNDIFLFPAMMIFVSGLLLSFLGIIISLIKINISKKNKQKSEFLIALKYLILNIINFPLAIIIAIGWFTLLQTYTVTIHNDTNQILENCLIEGGGIHKELGDIDPNKKKLSLFLIKQDGKLLLKYKSNQIFHEEVISGYVTNGMGDRKKINIK